MEQDPDSPRSLEIAISEAVEIVAQNDDTKYALVSSLNNVLLHQTEISQEAIKQMEIAGDNPDIVIVFAGGGSNFARITFPFLGEQLHGGQRVWAIAVEPAACPSMTRVQYAYDFGDTRNLTP